MTPLHPGVLPNCAECDGLGAVVVRDGEYARAEHCACLGACALCRGTEWVSDGEGKHAPRKRCICTLLGHRILQFNRANIPARHAASTRVSFKPSGAKQASALVGVSKWLDDYVPGEENRGLVLYGAVGRGKTHLLIAMLRELVFRYGASVRFVEFSHLLADLKSGFDRGHGTSRLIDPLVAVDVLAIDELGKGRNTEFEGTVLDELISRRYNAAATILATTNYEPKAATGKAVPNLAAAELGSAPPTLPDRVGARVFSRLEEMSDFMPVNGEDYRTKIRASKRRR